MTRKQKKNLTRIGASALLLIAAFVAETQLSPHLAIWQTLLLYLPAYLTVGYDVLLRAAKNILRGQVLDEHFLMTVATLGALSLGFLPNGEAEFAEAVFVMIFYQTGELFQSIAVGKSRRSISSLMRLKPDVARVLREDAELEVAPEEVVIGEEILILPGERVALDGVVTKGASELNTAALTGESLPRSVAMGDEVISGCTNLSGVLTVRVTKRFTESTVARILALIEDASAKRSKSEQFITRFARFYTPFVVLAALLVAFLPPIFTANYLAALPLWLSRALTFLVISCPCALVISVPLAFFGGIGGAARFGVLIKSSLDFERLATLSIVAFDKTGTLTTGECRVDQILPAEGTDKATLLAYAAAVEQHSNHPLAEAIVRASEDPLLPVTDAKELAGRGVIATVNGRRIAVGNARLMAEVGAPCPTAMHADGSAVFVAMDTRFLGTILVKDTVKSTAKRAIAALRTVGIDKTVMLTGDTEAVAASVAAELGIDSYRAALLPADKVSALEALQGEPRQGLVAFVGDGINDAPVLARADLGVAMGALGSDAAIEAAEVVVMDDELGKLALAVRHARRTLSIARQNIALSLTVKGAVMLLAALGVLGALQMPLAIFADVGVAALAILNAMRALHAPQ